MGGESCTVLRLRLMCKLAMPRIAKDQWPGLKRMYDSPIHES